MLSFLSEEALELLVGYSRPNSITDALQRA